jgi:hypothetical protein
MLPVVRRCEKLLRHYAAAIQLGQSARCIGRLVTASGLVGTLPIQSQSFKRWVH